MLTRCATVHGRPVVIALWAASSEAHSCAFHINPPTRTHARTHNHPLTHMCIIWQADVENLRKAHEGELHATRKSHAEEVAEHRASLEKKHAEAEAELAKKAEESSKALKEVEDELARKVGSQSPIRTESVSRLVSQSVSQSASQSLHKQQDGPQFSSLA